MVLLWALGAFGGILPDIDSNNSYALQILFAGLAAVMSLIILFRLATDYSIMELWILCGVAYIVIRHGMLKLFATFTVHRGIIHSLLAALCFSLFITVVLYRFVEVNSLFSWLCGVFLFFGFIVHLILDEIYSVDLMNAELKRSFGTALKFFDYKNGWTLFLSLSVCIGLWYISPSIEPLQKVIFSVQTWQHIADNFMPTGHWFRSLN